MLFVEYSSSLIIAICGICIGIFEDSTAAIEQLLNLCVCPTDTGITQHMTQCISLVHADITLHTESPDYLLCLPWLCM